MPVFIKPALINKTGADTINNINNTARSFLRILKVLFPEDLELPFFPSVLLFPSSVPGSSPIIISSSKPSFPGSS